VFFGTPEFAIPCLNALITAGEKISLVVTQTDKTMGRGHRLTPPPVKTTALSEGIRVLQPADLRDGSSSQEIAAADPEFIVVVAYGKILPKTILDIPKYGCVNVHASLLPKYRGAAPISWAIIRGEEKTGVTTMLMDEGLDTGPTLLREELEITEEETAGSLAKKLSELGASLLIETLKGIRGGAVRAIPQEGEASYAPPLRKGDGLIDWTRSAHELSCFIRGMQPWPGAFCHINTETVKMLKARVLSGNGLPAVIAEAGRNEMIVGTGKGLLSILELQPEGKKPMSATAFLQGRTLLPGTVIG
jgi:methionyl-tRNA formyltransferase